MGPFELLQRIVEILEMLNIPYLITGSIASMAYERTREGASVTIAIPWDVISYLARLAVHIDFWGGFGLAVDMRFRHISVALIISLLVIGF